MSADLEQALRDTLQDRAATIERGPQWSAPPAHRRSRGLAVAAATVAVLAVAGGALALRADHRSPAAEPTHAKNLTGCTASLPTAWRAAAHGDSVRVDGIAASPRLVLASGAVVVQWQAADRTWHASLALPSGATKQLASPPRGVLFSSWSAEGATVVLGSPSAAAPNGKPNPPTEITAIDVNTGARRQLLPDSSTPAGYSALDGAEIQDGIVYWGASPRSDGVGGVIIAHNLATGTSRIAARTPGSAFVTKDARGVHWDGGGVPAQHVPASVPSLTSAYQDVEGDGTTFGWNAPAADHADKDVVYWSASSGDAVRYTVHLPGNARGIPAVEAVAGPFVVLSPYGVPVARPTLYVLDTRTGAVADLGTDHVDTSVARDGLLAIADPHDATVRIDTTALPELRC